MAHTTVTLVCLMALAGITIGMTMPPMSFFPPQGVSKGSYKVPSVKLDLSMTAFTDKKIGAFRVDIGSEQEVYHFVNYFLPQGAYRNVRKGPQPGCFQITPANISVAFAQIFNNSESMGTVTIPKIRQQPLLLYTTTASRDTPFRGISKNNFFDPQTTYLIASQTLGAADNGYSILETFDGWESEELDPKIFRLPSECR